ncbi:MAG: VanZ family protein, partial [Lachnospiraceae bacterium]|nr:VanZ family protein [Lachnospiraceae bacterium]
MVKRNIIRLISFLLLIAYILGLILYLIPDVPVSVPGVEFKALRFPGFLENGLYVDYINQYVNYTIVFIPIGLLVPFIRAKRGLSPVVIFALLALSVYECLKYSVTGGIIAIDDELWTIAGTLIGYGFYVPVCTFTRLQEDFLSRSGSGTGWIAVSLIYALILFGLNYMSENDISFYDAQNETISSSHVPSSTLPGGSSETQSGALPASVPTVSSSQTVSDDRPVYDKLYEELSQYSRRVVFSNTTASPQDIFDDYLQLLDDHPEIFWL